MTYFYLVGSPSKINELLFIDYVVIGPEVPLGAYSRVKFPFDRFTLGI